MARREFNYDAVSLKKTLLAQLLNRHFIALHIISPLIGSNVGSIVDMWGDSPFIARRVNRVPLCPDLLHPLVPGFDNKNTFIQCFNSGPASQTVAQY